ncbi:RNA-dependent RNA polymerase [Beihai mantis shrimp virus 6]|uniref:RNA-dependent RNA polymerase n=1 Tax=Beihai mantis shrimp virus 6 TaxID=1922433 RepID=UPI00090AE1C5|nr:RNA-dependent RNA polymerase [Beihai mantis shrimp virus 6]APG76167.1 RNA-dependent RNA polymerase [Beihai mantis shrimp virus 6]
MGMLSFLARVWNCLKTFGSKSLLQAFKYAIGIVLAKVSYTLWQYGKHSAYDVTRPNLLRILARLLLDKTKQDLKKTWYPLELINPEARKSDNGHPVAGSARDSARRGITAAIDALGCRKFEVNPAGRTLDDTARDHDLLAPGDLTLDYKISRPVEGEVVTCIDTDYYVTEGGWDRLLGGGNLGILYTFSPVTVAGSDGECPFTIKDSTVEYTVSGGSVWRHRVWDWTAGGEYVLLYQQDYLDGDSSWMQYSVRQILQLLGFQAVTISKIHHARPFPNLAHRALVWIVPQYKAWVHGWLPFPLHLRRLRRVDYRCPSRAGWNMYSAILDGKLTTSVGREGCSAHVELPQEHLEVIMNLGSEHAVTSRALALGIKDPVDLALLGQMHKGVADFVDKPQVSCQPAKPTVHWPLASLADKPETTFRNYTNPIVADCMLVPMMKRWETLTISLERRVEYVSNRIPFPKWAQDYAHEFLRCVVPDNIMRTGVPYSVEDVGKMLTKPSQALGFRRVFDTLDVPHRRLIEGFPKKEPGLKPARLISSFNDARYLAHFSRFTLCARDEVLHAEHNKHWFCPGLTPLEIATKVQEFVCASEQVVEGDYSNFDGSVSADAQKCVMNAVYHRYFRSEFQEELTGYTSMLITCPARSKTFGFKYDAGVGVKSGSPTTCDANTVLNAFLQYIAVRRTLPELSPEDAFLQIGLAFGDDSLCNSQFSKAWTKAATQLGFALKVEKCAPDTGVTFLARVYPDAKASLTSFQDPVRTLRKAHLTGRDPNVPLPDAACDRAEGYLVTDKETPVLGEYFRFVLRHYGPQRTAKVRADSCSEKPYWLTQGGSWPQEAKDFDLMLHCMAARTSFEVETLRAMELHYKSAKDPWTPLPWVLGDEDPTRDTLNAEGLPSTGAVDSRTYEKDVERVIRDGKASVLRGTPEHGAAAPRDGGEVREGAGSAGASTPQQGQQGPGQPRSVHPQGTHGHHPRDRNDAGEANGQRVPGPQRTSSPGSGSPPTPSTTQGVRRGGNRRGRGGQRRGGRRGRGRPT